MSSNEFPDLNLLYTLALAEVQNTEIQQLKPNFYGTLSQFLGKLKIEEYDVIEKKTKKIEKKSDEFLIMKVYCKNNKKNSNFCTRYHTKSTKT